MSEEEKFVKAVEFCFANKLHEGNRNIKRYGWFFARFPEKNSLILEVGCNSGNSASWFSEKGYKVYALDLPKVIDNISHKNPNVKYIGHDITKFRGDFIDKFDVIVAGEVIQHVYYPDKMIDNLYKYLKNDGILFISTIREDNYIIPDKVTKTFFGDKFLDYLKIHKWNPLEHKNYGNHIWVSAKKELSSASSVSKSQT